MTFRNRRSPSRNSSSRSSSGQLASRQGTPAQSPAARITAEIVARLEAGTKPWIKPWRGAPFSRPLRACGIPYRGMNVFWLWMVADIYGYASPFWMTYQQAKALGGQVRKGAKSTIAILYKSYSKEVEAPDTGERSDEQRRVLKAYAVFNADQVEGLPAHFHPQPLAASPEPAGRREELDRFFAALPASLRHLGDQAYYEPVLDRITMPPSELFTDFDHYYATLAHEQSHWTGHSTRLGRDLKHRFGSAAYAAEELVAELSSAILGAELGLPVAHLDSHASYIEHWLRLLKSDDRAILTAAAKAEEAGSLLLRLGGREVETEPRSRDEAEETVEAESKAESDAEAEVEAKTPSETDARAPVALAA